MWWIMAVILPGDVKGARKRIRTGAPIRTPRAIEVEYRRALSELNRAIKASTRLIGRAINEGTGRAEVIRLLEQQIATSRARYQTIAGQLAGGMTDALSERGKEQVEGMLRRALGVDFASITDGTAVGEQLEVAKLRNAELIKSIPEKHWAEVVQAISDNYEGREFEAGSLSRRLQEIGGVTDGRAGMIARDQTAKLASDLTRIRQQDAGIESYTWRNSQDGRVVGNPTGRYPKGNARHQDHWSREGKEFRWDTPPPDGHPGQAILCRCRAEPVIDLDKLNAIYV